MDETRKEILETAREILLTEGYQGLTIQRLADELDVTGAGIYYHFDSKDDLLVAYLEYNNRVHEETLSAMEGTPQQRLIAMLQDLWDAVETVRQIEVLPPTVQLLAATTGADDAMREALLSLRETYIAHLSETIQEGVECGVFETERPEETARTLWAIVEGADIRAAFDRPSDPLVWGMTRYVLSELCVEDPPELASLDGPSEQGVDP